MAELQSSNSSQEHVDIERNSIAVKFDPIKKVIEGSASGNKDHAIRIVSF